MTTSLQTTTWFRSAAWVVAIAAGAGCQIIAGIDRSDLGMSGVGGAAGSAGSTLIGSGGSSGSDQDAEAVPDGSGDDVSMPTDDTGVGGSSTLGSGGGSGTGGSEPPDGGGGTNGTGGSIGTGGTLGTGGSGMTDGPVVVPDSGPQCGGVVPAGWTLVVRSATGAACPVGYGTAQPAVTATANPGACTCTGCVTTTGTCGQGTATALVAPGQGNDACVTAWFNNVAVNGCTTVPAVGSDHVQATVTAATTGTGGVCSPGNPTANTAQLAITRETWCDATSQSTAVCNGTPPAGFSACIMFPGVVGTCPSGSGFTQNPPITLHDGTATLNCSACSACTTQTTCSAPVLQGFAGTACGGTAIDIPFTSPSSCLDANPNETAIGSIRLTGTANSTCTNGTSMGSPAYAGTARTFCCK